MSLISFQQPSSRPNYNSININDYAFEFISNGFGVRVFTAGFLIISEVSNSANCVIKVNDVEFAQFFGSHRPIITIPVNYRDIVYFSGSSSFSPDAFKIVLIPYA